MKHFKEYIGIGFSAAPVADLGDIPDYRRLSAQLKKEKDRKKKMISLKAFKSDKTKN